MKAAIVFLSVSLFLMSACSGLVLFQQHKDIKTLQYQVLVLSSQQSKLKSRTGKIESRVKRIVSIQKQVVETINEIVEMINSAPDPSSFPKENKDSL